MSKIKLYLSILLAIVFLCVCVVPIYAQTNIPNAESNEKISQELLEMLSDEKNDSIPVIIFLKSCDKSVAYKKLLEKYGYDTTAYEDYKRYYTEVIPNISVGGKTISEILNGENASVEVLSLENNNSPLSISERRAINIASVNNSNTYLKRYREEISSVIIDYTESYLEIIDKQVKDIIYKPKYGEFVIVNIDSSAIKNIAKMPIVNNISYFQDDICVPESWNATLLTHTDTVTGLGSSYYNNGNGYDGTGIKIGIIEANNAKCDISNYNLTEADITFVNMEGLPVPSTTDDHATNVTSLICGKNITIGNRTYNGAAREAEICQTGTYNCIDVCHAIEYFIDEGFDVVNYSGGLDTGDGYHIFDQAVDNLVFNGRLCFVKSAGNTAGVITSPGKAYNVITVGNLCTKGNNNSALSAPYSLSYYSSYAEGMNLTNKPDVVAPGTNLYLPFSSNVVGNIYSGTSYSAPIVTGMIAQMMQYDTYSIENPNCVKNHIICSADNTEISNTTQSFGQLTEESGAGLVNAISCKEAAKYSNNMFGVISIPYQYMGEYRTKVTLNLNANQHFRTVLTFEKEEDISLPLPTENNINPDDYVYGNNLDLRLIKDDGTTLIADSDSLKNNVEVIDAVIPSSGVYLLQVRFTDSILNNTNSDLHYWLSWRTY